LDSALSLVPGSDRILCLTDIAVQTKHGHINRVNRAVAAILALVWACAGVAGLVAAYVYGRWLVGIAAVFALCYALLWVRVVVRARLLKWSEIARPWR
jgi:uncharacterized membrane protein YfcA